MSDRARSPSEINQAIRDSAGMHFLNQEHSRSFSLNIFRANARELIEALRHVSDPEHGLRLMSVDNREAGTQAHREVSRRIHNFVAAAKTLVDHTRVFIEGHYDQSDFLREYNAEVKRRFSENQMAKFVHDLRNYMLHKGLPNSAMFVEYSRNPEQPDQPARLTTGVRLSAKDLREWNGWTAPARAYLCTVKGELEIENIVRAYLSHVEEFQSWLRERFNEIHSDDISKLQLLHEELASSEGEIEELREEGGVEEDVARDTAKVDPDSFSIPAATAIEIDEIGDKLLNNIRKIDFVPLQQQGFKSERPVGATITADDIIDQPIVWREDANGNQVLAFILQQSEIYGLDSRSLSAILQIVNAVLSVPWAERSLSEKFIERTIIDWCRSAFTSNTTVKLAEAITSASRVEVKSVDVWAPISHLEIESGFSFGPIDILPITAEMINGLEAEGLASASSQQGQIRKMFDHLRSKMQGCAAVVVKLNAVGERAAAEGLAIASEAVNLLRFFSPAASEASLLCPTSLLGSEVVPVSHILVLGDGAFSYSERVATSGVTYWRMSEADIAELQQAFEATGALIRTEQLSEFERSVRSGMILFGTAATFKESSDRLVYTLSAMEGILLKHELEAAAYSVEERMARLLANADVKPDEIAHNVRAIYRLRARHGALQWTVLDREVLQEFVRNAQNVLLIALRNVANFGTRAEFIEEIERIVWS